VKLSRVLLLSLAAVAITPSTSTQAQQPSLQIQRESSGVLRLSTTGDTNRAVLEQTDSLWPLINWQPAAVNPEGVVVNEVSVRVFRLRLLPGPPLPASAALLGPVTFPGAPPQVKAGERVQFEVVGQANSTVDALWSVNGIPSGSAAVGFINASGVFSAPPVPSGPFVTIQAEVVSANGDRSYAQTIIHVAPQAADPSKPVQAAVGGEVESDDGQNSLVVPPGALKQDTILSIAPGTADQLEAFNANDDADFDVVAMAVLGPDGSVFNAPLTVKLRLDRWVNPGTRLPIEILDADSTWDPAGVEGEVAEDGLTVVFQMPHFTTMRAILVRGPTLSLGPTVQEIIPAEIWEGELRPILLRGNNFAASMRVTAHPNANLGPAPLLQVVSKAFDPSAPKEFGVLIKSLPDPSLPFGSVRNYTLRLRPVRGQATTVTIKIMGLDEFVVPAGTTLDLSTLPGPVSSSLRFSKIDVQAGATLISRSTLLAWQATDSVYIHGQVLTRGSAGNDGVLGAGGVPTPGVEAGGRGGSITIPAGDGNPVLTPNLNDFLPGSMDARYGQAGSNGHDPGSGDYLDSLNAISEGMYQLYDQAVNSRTRDPFDFDFWRRVAHELTDLHPEGRKGQQGHPGGFIPRPPRSGFYVGSRRAERGGGGGGGGASFRPNSIDANTDNLRIGLGGGSGGGGGGAISFAAGNELIIGPNALIDTRGGDGGDGASPVASDFSNPSLVGHGAGGGPGGAGSIHLLAGQRLTGGNGPPFLHTSGQWGTGGFLMVLGSHRQANPHSWIEPAEELQARSQAEVAGPDFANRAGSLQTRIQTDTFVKAPAQNPYTQAADVTVMNSKGSRTFRLVGTSPNNRRVSVLLKPGTNYVVVASSPDHAVLNRHVLVLATTDSDGDCVPDSQELLIGTDPNLSDTDGDSIPDGEELLTGNAGVPGDSDGDGFPDVVEVSLVSNPNDPSSTPLDTNLGTGINRGLIIASPQVIAIRPVFVPVNEGKPIFTVANPPDVRVVRPVIGAAFGVPFNKTIAQPQSVIVHRQ